MLPKERQLFHGGIIPFHILEAFGFLMLTKPQTLLSYLTRAQVFILKKFHPGRGVVEWFAFLNQSQSMLLKKKARAWIDGGLLWSFMSKMHTIPQLVLAQCIISNFRSHKYCQHINCLVANKQAVQKKDGLSTRQPKKQGMCTARAKLLAQQCIQQNDSSLIKISKMEDSVKKAILVKKDRTVSLISKFLV